MLNLKTNILIAFALESESRGRFSDCAVCYTGVGKVNAAYHLSQAIYNWRQEHGRDPELILNLGSAGSPVFPAGSVVNCTSFIQRDMDVAALGFRAFETPFDPTPVPMVYGLRYPDYPEACCGTGDHFVDDATEHAWQVVDMEAFALARVAQTEKIPFACLKFISDGADGKAALEWEKALDQGAGLLREAAEIVFNKL